MIGSKGLKFSGFNGGSPWGGCMEVHSEDRSKTLPVELLYLEIY